MVGDRKEVNSILVDARVVYGIWYVVCGMWYVVGGIA